MSPEKRIKAQESAMRAQCEDKRGASRVESSQWSEQQGVTLETLTPTQLFEYRLSSEEHLSDVQQEQLTLLYKQVLADVEAQS